MIWLLLWTEPNVSIVHMLECLLVWHTCCIVEVASVERLILLEDWWVRCSLIVVWEVLRMLLTGSWATSIWAGRRCVVVRQLQVTETVQDLLRVRITELGIELLRRCCRRERLTRSLHLLLGMLLLLHVVRVEWLCEGLRWLLENW